MRKRGETPWREGGEGRRRGERSGKTERRESEAKKRAERRLHGERWNALERESTFGVRNWEMNVASTSLERFKISIFGPLQLS